MIGIDDGDDDKEGDKGDKGGLLCTGLGEIVLILFGEIEEEVI